jgi:hypothetical protein
MDGAPLRTLPKVSSGYCAEREEPVGGGQRAWRGRSPGGLADDVADAGVRPLGHTLSRFGFRLFAGLPAAAMRAELARPGLQFVNEQVPAPRAESGGWRKERFACGGRRPVCPPPEQPARRPAVKDWGVTPVRTRRKSGCV